MESNPDMVEESVWSQNGTDICVAFPIVPPKGSILKSDLLGTKQLDFVKKAQEIWVEEGTNVELCRDPRIRHNVSNTITVDDWEAVTDYVYENRYSLCGISFLAASGDKAYPQAPNTETFTMEEITTKYGEKALFTSALIEHGLSAFSNDLWSACIYATGDRSSLADTHENMSKLDWLRRFDKFAKNFITETFSDEDKRQYRKIQRDIERSKNDLIYALDILATTPKEDSDYEEAVQTTKALSDLIDTTESLLISHPIAKATATAKEECTYCLKDVYNLHKMWRIKASFSQIDWSKINKQTYTDIDTMGAVACAGGKCEL